MSAFHKRNQAIRGSECRVSPEDALDLRSGPSLAAALTGTGKTANLIGKLVGVLLQLCGLFADPASALLVV